MELVVAPARERGLKYYEELGGSADKRRSRKGAWIEITVIPFLAASTLGRSRKGAWIEILPWA